MKNIKTDYLTLIGDDFCTKHEEFLINQIRDHLRNEILYNISDEDFLLLLEEKCKKLIPRFLTKNFKITVYNN